MSDGIQLRPKITYYWVRGSRYRWNEALPGLIWVQTVFKGLQLCMAGNLVKYILMLKKEGHPGHCIIQKCNCPFTLHTGQCNVDEVLHPQVLPIFCTVGTIFLFSQDKPTPPHPPPPPTPPPIPTTWLGTVCKLVPVMSTILTGHPDTLIDPYSSTKPDGTCHVSRYLNWNSTRMVRDIRTLVKSA